MNLRHLEVFYEIMTTGSVTAAARNLGVSQPACSITLKHAETTLGFTLFERQGGRLVPTPEARLLFPEAETIFGQLSTLRRVAKDLKGGRLGRLSVASSPGLITAILPRAVASFSTKYEVQGVSLLSLPRDEVIERVRRAEIDFGIVFDEVPPEGLRVSRLGTAEVACALPRTHPLATLPALEAAHLASERIISYSSNSLLGRLIAESFAMAGVPHPPIAVEVNSAMTACMVAAELNGIALIEPLVLSSGMFPALAVRSFRPGIAIQIALIQPDTQVPSRLARAFVQHLIRNMPRMSDVLGPTP